MKIVRKAVSMFCCLTSTMLVAGSMGTICKPGDVTTPCVGSGWGVGAQALYLRVDFPSLNYIGSTTVSTLKSSQENFIDKQIDYGFGFKLETFYNFNTGKDLNLNWYHYNHTTKKSLPSPINVFDTTFAGTVTVRYNPKWDAVNLELGQRIDIAPWGNLRLHGGLQYADVVLNNITTGTKFILGNGERRVNASSFQGVGPRIGTDLLCDLKYGIALYSNVAAAFLTGRNHFKRQINTIIVNGYYLDENSGSSNATVTELEGKLGATYTYSLKNGLLHLDAGWMWVNYYDAIEIADSFHNGRTKESNFAVQGPFVGLKWAGDLI